MAKETGFYMLYAEGGGSPTYKHETLFAAELEAERLAAWLDTKVYILKTYKSVSCEKTFVNKKMGKPNEDALPF